MPDIPTEALQAAAEVIARAMSRHMMLRKSTEEIAEGVIVALHEDGLVVVSTDDLENLEAHARRLTRINRRLEVRLASARNLCARSPLCVPESAALPEAHDDDRGEPAPGTYWERAVLERFVTGGPVDMEAVRQQVAALLSEIPREPSADLPERTENA